MTSATAAKMRDAWIVRPRPYPAASLRVFCFPYAGVGPSVYRTWSAAFPSSVELVLVQPPGREGRWAEKPFQHLDLLVRSAAENLLPYLTAPFVFFGHSLGALTCFEVTRQLRRNRHPQPSHLFVSAHRAPQLPNPHAQIRTLSDRDFVDRICDTYGGIPQPVLENAELLELVLVCLRADFTVFETYRFRDEPPLACPITAFGGTDDRRVSADEVAAWRAQTAGDFRWQMFQGGHFFFQERHDEVLTSIKQDLTGRGLLSS